MTTGDDLAAIFARTDEELLPELRRYYETSPTLGSILRHPLVYQVMGVHNALANYQYREKTRRLDEAHAAGDWRAVVFLHERPWRLDAFAALAADDCITDDEQYWSLLGSIWTDSENLWQSLDEWIALLSADRPGREHLMSEDARAVFATLPDTLTVHRGADRGVNEHGPSWTLDEDKAHWFAQRFHTDPVVLSGTVAKAHVLAYFDDRGEDEVLILHPEDHVTVRDRRRGRLARRP